MSSAAAIFLLVSIIPLFQTSLNVEAQTPVLGDQPYFRGLISALPLSNSQGEFLPSPGDNERPVVTIGDGTLQGFTMRTINGRPISAFQSIPYAEPPVGSLRFRDPVKNKPWTGIRSALPQSPQCTQLDLARVLQIHGQEDCLYLNVYTPQRSNNSSLPLPVMVWLHGGGFFFGAGGIYGPRYLLDQEVILVTLNYRLGPFGFFSTGDAASPGNQGLKDQVLALKWVQANIAAFGGDPNSQTIFGQSVGASSVGLHVVSPLSKGLFHRAIAESSSALCFWANIHNASDTARKVGEIFQCPTDSSEEMVNCLRNVPDKMLAPVQLAFIEWFLYPLVVFGPTVEPDLPGAFLAKTPEQYYQAGEAANVPMVTGLTSHEMSWLVSAMIHDPIHVGDINREWERVGPIMLALDYNTTEVNVDRATKVWEFYMGNNKLEWNTRHEFATLFGDRFVTECVLDAMRYHSIYTKQPVYAYQFSFQGRYSNVQQYGGKPEDWGVAHLDELIYLLNNPDYYATLKSGDEPDTQMSALITTIWANFATHGKPTIPDSKNSSGSSITTSSEIWQPIEPATDRFSPLRFLELNISPKMITDPYVERYNFWRLVINPNP